MFGRMDEIIENELNRSRYGLALVKTTETDKANMKDVKQMTVRLK